MNAFEEADGLRMNPFEEEAYVQSLRNKALRDKFAWVGQPPIAESEPTRSELEYQDYKDLRDDDEWLRHRRQVMNPNAIMPHGPLYHREQSLRPGFAPAGSSEDRIRELLRYRATQLADPDIYR